MNLLLIAAVVLFLMLASMTTYEHMTNKDLMSALQTFGTKDASKKETDKPQQAPIYGPRVAPVEQPTPVKPPTKSSSDSGVYPDIYGPEVVATPGEKIVHGKQASDETEPEYNPDFQNAFPTSGPPQPFLADFSKFQK